MITTATLPLTTANGTTGAAAGAGGAAPLAGLSPAATAAGRPGMSFEAWLAGAVAATADGEPLPVAAGNGLPPTGEGLPLTAAPGLETGADGADGDGSEDPTADELAALLAAAEPEPAPEPAPVAPPGVTLLAAATPAPPPTPQTVSLTPPPGSGMTGRLLGVRGSLPATPPAPDPAAAAQNQTAALPQTATAAIQATGEPAADDFATVARALESAAVDAPASETGATIARENPARQYQHLAGASASAAVPVPVGKPGWSEAVVDKVMWFSAQQLSSAEIQLNPPELGPLQVRVSTHQDQTSVYFSSHHAAVRDALDQTLPRLREMMDNQGILLLDVGVGEHGSARQQAFRGDGDGRGGAGAQAEVGEAAAETATVTTRAPVAAGLVDAYA